MLASKFLPRRLPAAAVLTLLSSTESLWSLEMVGFASSVENYSVLWFGPPPCRLEFVLDQCMATASLTAILGYYFCRILFCTASILLAVPLDWTTLKLGDSLLN